jgi:hypothetical protein
MKISVQRCTRGPYPVLATPWLFPQGTSRATNIGQRPSTAVLRLRATLTSSVVAGQRVSRRGSSPLSSTLDLSRDSGQTELSGFGFSVSLDRWTFRGLVVASGVDRELANKQSELEPNVGDTVVRRPRSAWTL